MLRHPIGVCFYASLMKLRHWCITGSLALASAFVFILSSCSTVERTVVETPFIEGASFVGNKACYECHTNYTRSFPPAPMPGCMSARRR